MDFRRPAARVVLALLGLGALAALVAAAWFAHVDSRTAAVAVADPRLAYISGIRERIQIATDAAYADGSPHGRTGSLELRIQVGPDGKLISTIVDRPSGDPALDELARRIVAESAPFEPFPPDVRRTTQVMEINSTFYFR